MLHPKFGKKIFVCKEIQSEEVLKSAFNPRHTSCSSNQLLLFPLAATVGVTMILHSLVHTAFWGGGCSKLDLSISSSCCSLLTCASPEKTRKEHNDSHRCGHCCTSVLLLNGFSHSPFLTNFQHECIPEVWEQVFPYLTPKI